MSPPLTIVLQSTDHVELAPPPGRVWIGYSDEGSEVTACITILSRPTGDADRDARLQQALETRIPSSALITIPLPAAGVDDLVAAVEELLGCTGVTTDAAGLGAILRVREQLDKVRGR